MDFLLKVAAVEDQTGYQVVENRNQAVGTLNQRDQSGNPNLLLVLSLSLGAEKVRENDGRIRGRRGWEDKNRLLYEGDRANT